MFVGEGSDPGCDVLSLEEVETPELTVSTTAGVLVALPKALARLDLATLLDEDSASAPSFLA
jgi:hypothetical protein